MNKASGRFLTLRVVARTLAVLSAFLLGAVSAQAATVEKDGDLATGISGLTIGSSTYDVMFSCKASTEDTYGNPPEFEFPSAQDAATAIQAVIAAINAAGGALAVGCGQSEGQFSKYVFRQAYAERELSIPVSGGSFPDGQTLRIDALAVWEAVSGDRDNPGLWALREEEEQFLPYGADSVVPIYTLASGGGAGNNAPTADPGGPYSGVVGDPISFDGSGSTDLDGNIIQWEWSFGDGTFGSGETTSHSYDTADDFTVILTVTDDGGLSAARTTTVTVGANSQRPIADAGGPYSGRVGSAIAFDGTGSSDPEGTSLSYSWDFGDESSPRGGAKPTHTYTASGSYQVKLTVTDAGGDTGVSLTTAQVTKGNSPPTADAGGSYYGETLHPLDFDGTGSSDPDGNITFYAWDFGDGNTDTGATPTHNYSEPGSYTATLTVFDSAGATDSESTTVIVVDKLPPGFTGGIKLAALEDLDTGAGGGNAALVPGSDGENVVHVTRVEDGARIRSFEMFDSSWTAFDLAGMEDVNGDDSPDVGALAVQSGTQDIAVQVRDALTGSFIKNLFFLAPEWTALQVLGIPSNDLNPGPEVGVLATNPDTGEIIVQVKDAVTNEFIRNVFFLNDQWYPLQAIVIPGFDANEGDEIGVLAVNRQTKQIVVQVKDMLTNTFIKNVFFLNAGWSAVGVAYVSSAGNAGPVLGLLASNRSSKEIVTQLKDASTGAFVRNIFHLGSAWTPRGIAVVPPISTVDDELAVLATNVDGKPIIQNRDAGTDAYINDIRLLGPTWTVLGMEAFDSAGGSSNPEISVIARRKSDGIYVVETYDAATGDKVSSVELP